VWPCLSGGKSGLSLTLLGVLILFFTFLTGYAYASGKFKNCGCFGDCLPITPLTSFLKDIVLLVLIAALWFGRKYIQPLQPKRTQWVTLGFFSSSEHWPAMVCAFVFAGCRLPAF
jgi:hypothetical protein